MKDTPRVQTVEFIGTALPADLEGRLFKYAEHTTKRLLGQGGENADRLAERSNLYRADIIREMLPLLRASESGRGLSLRTRMRMAWEKAVDSERSQIQGDQSANYELMYARLWEQVGCAAAFGAEQSAAEGRDIPPLHAIPERNRRACHVAAVRRSSPRLATHEGSSHRHDGGWRDFAAQSRALG